VLPRCTIGNYFFPKGYEYYKQAFIRVTTDYEISILKALSCLPTTSYVLPLEKGIIINFFHDNVNKLMTAIQEIEEIGVLKTYSLEVPHEYSISSSSDS
jgi:hypothetical protein